jgi:hypothetical protein
MSTERLLLWPIKMRDYCFDAGPFQKANEEAGGKNVGHNKKLIGLGVEGRDRLGPRNHKAVLVENAWLQ